MSMTKKDYILIAGVLKEVGEFAQIPTADKKYNNGKYDSYYMAVNKLSGRFEQDNDKFKREVFLRECGIGESDE